ncbi:hypothetical protein G6F57_017972 [Rhizopus arrhizus]|nr:hypothetical protein G6F57_017972 [Rhizopus arrhizus]
MQRLTHHFIAVLLGEALGGAFHVLAPGIVLVDGVHAFAQRAVGRHHRGQRLHAQVGVGGEAEVVEVALLARQFQRLAAHVQEDDFLARVAQVVLAHVFGQLARDGGRRTLHQDLHAFGSGGAEAVGRAHGAALVVEFDQFQRLAVPAAGGVDAVQFVLDRGAEHQAGLGLRARQRFDQTDLDGCGVRRCGNAGQAQQACGESQFHACLLRGTGVVSP